jgi:hypothetical protein
MKRLLLAFLTLSALTLQGQDLQLFAHTPGETADGKAVGGNYSFPDTAVGDQSQTVFRVRNTSTTQVYLVRAVFSMDPSFLVAGTSLDRCLSTGSAEDFTVTFSPRATGALSTVLQIGSKVYPASAGCPADSPQSVDITTLTSLQGNATGATLDVSYSPDGTTITELSGGSPHQFRPGRSRFL